ncbi:hypothetical protein AvCA_22020 [Azotobacter vinelandii CA]|uniref:Uncharacterized protein n=2 Tax=Azotobacter vinelandii TaxID=354 RepID=C1DG82_AZOVD|nr:hypothetical protein Avin_22020 [Azotobacter vinelandii DJ]AGK16747.1 hypothetical protein AvCA_22020 [Azotobacter vinelandii CA]AGK20471.1 hypothetical protein AvCA6_22020 [Azotobacter vinelandii CA6]
MASVLRGEGSFDFLRKIFTGNKNNEELQSSFFSAP